MSTVRVRWLVVAVVALGAPAPAPAPAPAANIPIAVSGFNSDIVASSPTDLVVRADPFGQNGAATSWFSAGAVDNFGVTHPDGLPMGTTFLSAATNGGGTVFQMQPVNSNNNLRLGDGHAGVGTLTLDGTTGYRSLSVLAVSYNGGGTPTLTIHYNGAPDQTVSYFAFDWNASVFGDATNRALTGLGRNEGLVGASGATPGMGFVYGHPTGFGLYETVITPDSDAPITGIDFRQAIVNGNPTSIFALSGTPGPAPEPGTLTLMGLGGLALLGYGWRRRPTPGG